MDAAVILRALRAGIRLRDRVVVLEIDAAAGSDPARLEAIAADVALARALGIRVVTVCEPGVGPGPLDAQGPALRLIAALERHGERGVALPAAGLVTVHLIPAAALAAAPGTPPMIPVVNTTVLIHLSALGYLPILLPPVIDAEGQAVALGAGALAVFLAQFLSGALLLLSAPREAVTPSDGLPPVPPIVVMGPTSPGSLIVDLLLNASDAPADAATPAGLGTSSVSLS